MPLGRRVIVVDDDRAVLASLDALFWVRDYSVRTFESGLSLVRELPNLSPSCIVTDFDMTGLDGTTLVKTLRLEAGVDWPVIVIGGRGTPVEIDRALQAGAFDVLAKPFRPAHLLARVEQAMMAYAATAVPDPLP